MNEIPIQLDYASAAPPAPLERYGKAAAILIGLNAFGSIWLVAMGFFSIDLGWMAGFSLFGGLLMAVATLKFLSRKIPRFRLAILMVTMSLALQIAAIVLGYRMGKHASANVNPNIQIYDVSLMSDDMRVDAARSFLQNMTVCGTLLAVPLWVYILTKLGTARDQNE